MTLSQKDMRKLFPKFYRVRVLHRNSFKGVTTNPFKYQGRNVDMIFILFSSSRRSFEVFLETISSIQPKELLKGSSFHSFSSHSVKLLISCAPFIHTVPVSFTVRWLHWIQGTQSNWLPTQKKQANQSTKNMIDVLIFMISAIWTNSSAKYTLHFSPHLRLDLRAVFIPFPSERLERYQ